MSTYAEKLLKGEIPTDEEWTDHLVEAHHRAPSMTPQAFAAYKNAEGLNSYEVLASAVDSNAHTVIDLACGDGALVPSMLPRLSPAARVIGIDMSETELAEAKRTVNDARVAFMLAKAQNMPVPAQCADVVLCHMAFMLMLPVEPVVAELARVLKPGGTFCAITGNRSTTGLYAEILSTALQLMSARYPNFKAARAGDSRTSTLEGFRSLFRQDFGFSPEVERVPFELAVRTDADGVWEYMKNMYFAGMLPDEDRVLLRRRLHALAEERADAQGQVSFAVPMLKWTVRKEPSQGAP